MKPPCSPRPDPDGLRPPAAPPTARLHPFWPALCCLLLCFSVLPSVASPSDLSFGNPEDGLSDSHPLAIDQGMDGRLWLLDRVAVRVFDGTRSITYNSSHGLALTRVGDLTVDSEGHPWVASGWGEPTVFELRGESWHPLPRIPADHFFDTALYLAVLCRDGRRLIVMATGTDGLWLWRYEPGSPASISEPFRPAGSLPSQNITALSEFDDRIAVGTGQGLCLLSFDGELDCGTPRVDARLGAPIHALAATGPGGGEARRLWIWGSPPGEPAARRGEPAPSWIGFLQDDTLTVHFGEADLPEVVLDPKSVAVSQNLLQPDSGGGLYFGNARTLRYVSPRGRHQRILSEDDPSAPPGASSLFLDGEGFVWLGTVEGARRMPVRRFANLGGRDGLIEDEVTAVLQLASGPLLLGHNLGLTLIEGEKKTTFAFDQPSEDERNSMRVFDMEQDDAGFVWLSTYTAGLLRFDPASRRIEHCDQIELSRSLERSADGRLWVADERKIYQIVDGRLRPHPVATGADYIRWLESTADGRLLITTPGGLFIVDDASSRRAVADKETQNNLFSVQEMSDGEIWVGSLDGPLRLDGERLVPLEAPFPSLAHPVFFIFETPDHDVWLGTEDGVFVWNGRSLRHLTVRHGLAGREVNRGAGYVAPDGEIMIGTDRGLSRYQPSYDRRPGAPPFELTEVEVAGRHHRLDEPLLLEPSENSLTFHFRAVTFDHEEPLSVTYSLDGFDPSLQGPMPMAASTLRYTNLPHGTYRLRLSVGRRGGARGVEKISAPITIRRPLWQHPLFRSGLLILIAGTVLGIYDLRTRSVRRRSRQLEAMNRRLQEAAEEREHLIQSLEAKNVELERFTFTVSHDLKSPLVTIRGFLGFVRQARIDGRFEDMDEDLGRIDAAADKMGRLLDELLELARVGRVVNPPERCCLDDLTREVLSLTAAKIREAGAEVFIADNLPMIYGDRLRLRMVLQNLIENAVKFSRPGIRPRICVEGHSRLGADGQTESVFEVSDNGLGIEVEQLDHVFGLFKRLHAEIPGTGVGLALVRRIVEAHRGKVWVESGGPGRGSRFIVCLPDPGSN